MVLSLDDLINLALQDNQVIEVVRQRKAQSKGQLTQAQSGYLPHLILDGSYNYTERKDSASSSGGENVLVDFQIIEQELDETETDDVIYPSLPDFPS